MPKSYRVMFFEHGLKRRSDVVWADDDADAIQKTREQYLSNDIEIWDGMRIVAKLETETP